MKDIEKAKEEMLTVLKQELLYLAMRQVFATVISIVLIAEILNIVGVGFTTTMIGLFRVLSVGYALYAVGNTILLYLLYFSADQSALYPALTLFVVNAIGTAYTISQPANFYGFGFVAAALAMFIVGWWKLVSFTQHLEYHVFCQQPVFIEENQGLFVKLVRKRELRNASNNRSD